MGAKPMRNGTRGAARRARATLRKNSQVTVPAEVRRVLDVVEGDELEFAISENGEVVLRGMTVIPTDQRWFWTPEWQAGEREASEQLAHGEGAVHADADAMFDHLKS